MDLYNEWIAGIVVTDPRYLVVSFDVLMGYVCALSSVVWSCGICPHSYLLLDSYLEVIELQASIWATLIYG